MPEPKLIAVRTLKKITESPEEFARLLLENIGTDATEDFLDRVQNIWIDEGCHK